MNTEKASKRKELYSFLENFKENLVEKLSYVGVRDIDINKIVISKKDYYEKIKPIINFAEKENLVEYLNHLGYVGNFIIINDDMETWKRLIDKGFKPFVYTDLVMRQDPGLISCPLNNLIQTINHIYNSSNIEKTEYPFVIVNPKEEFEQTTTNYNKNYIIQNFRINTLTNIKEKNKDEEIKKTINKHLSYLSYFIEKNDLKNLFEEGYTPNYIEHYRIYAEEYKGTEKIIDDIFLMEIIKPELNILKNQNLKNEIISCFLNNLTIENIEYFFMSLNQEKIYKANIEAVIKNLNKNIFNSFRKDGLDFIRIVLKIGNDKITEETLKWYKKNNISYEKENPITKESFFDFYIKDKIQKFEIYFLNQNYIGKSIKFIDGPLDTKKTNEKFVSSLDKEKANFIYKDLMDNATATKFKKISKFIEELGIEIEWEKKQPKVANNKIIQTPFSIDFLLNNKKEKIIKNKFEILKEELEKITEETYLENSFHFDQAIYGFYLPFEIADFYFDKVKNKINEKEKMDLAIQILYNITISNYGRLEDKEYCQTKSIYFLEKLSKEKNVNFNDYDKKGKPYFFHLFDKLVQRKSFYTNFDDLIIFICSKNNIDITLETKNEKLSYPLYNSLNSEKNKIFDFIYEKQLLQELNNIEKTDKSENNNKNLIIKTKNRF